MHVHVLLLLPSLTLPLAGITSSSVFTYVVTLCCDCACRSTSVYAALNTDPTLSSFAEAVQAAGLMNILWNTRTDMTVFAPVGVAWSVGGRCDNHNRALFLQCRC